MPGSATLGTNLIDDLVVDVDELRADLNSDFGTRAWRVFTVLRSWSGQEQGEGDHSDVVNEISPQPLVRFRDGFKWQLTPLGTHETGEVQISEVSLTYALADLTPTVRTNQQFFYVLREAYGQDQPDRYLRVTAPPYPDRVKGIGWILTCQDEHVPSNLVPVLPS